MGLLFQSWSQHLCVPISSSAYPQGVLTGNDSWKCVLKQRPGDWGPSETEAVPRKQRWFTSWGHRCRGCLGITWEHHLLLREASETGLRALPLQAGRHRGIWGMAAEKQGSPPCEPRRVSGEPPLARSPSRSTASQRICAPSGPPLPRVWCFCPRSAWTHTEEAPGRAAEKRDCDRAPCSWVRTSHSVRGLSLFGGCNVGLGVSTFSLVLSVPWPRKQYPRSFAASCSNRVSPCPRVYSYVGGCRMSVWTGVRGTSCLLMCCLGRQVLVTRLMDLWVTDTVIGEIRVHRVLDLWTGRGWGWVLYLWHACLSV